MPSQNPYTVRHLGDVGGGDHICYLCQSDEEKWRVLAQFYKAGLERNEKMMFFQHSTPEEEVLARLEEGGVVGIRDCVTSGQFTVRYYNDVYMTGGKFAPEHMVSRLTEFTDACVSEGYSALRICGDMSWVNKEQDVTSKLVQYESMLNHQFPQNYAALCMYDVRQFKPSDMLQVLATHPQAIINEKLLQNIYYMPPEEYLGADVDKAMLNRWMHNIEERKSIEEQLIASRVQAERAAHAKASFLATMSHEIRNPTNGIIGSVDMLAQTYVSPEQVEFVNIIQASAKHLYRVVNDVLDFSKIESGKLELNMAPILVKDLLEDSRRLCQYSTQKNLAVTLKCYADPGCPDIIVGDETRLRQILVNLVGNACKFTEEGEVLVSVEPVVGLFEDGETQLEAEENKREWKKRVVFLEFSVSDSGMGISEDDLSKLFTQFTQIDVTQKFAGTGLGLVICKQLVEAMGGSIQVRSEMGKGSTFYFRIPSEPPFYSPPISPSLPFTSSPSLIGDPPPPPPISLSPELYSTPTPTSTSHSPRGSQRPRFVLPLKSLPFPLEDSPPTSLSERRGSTPPPFSYISPRTSSAASTLSHSSPLPSPLVSPKINPDIPPPPTFDFSGEHILVVEDDVTNQKILSHMLRKVNCKVTVASNGFEAINLAKQNDYSLILTDQYMPVCDGFAAVTQIRAYFAELALTPVSPAAWPARVRRCPTIVVCTGTYEARLNEVMDDILIKPIRFKTITDLLARYCSNKAA